MQANDHEDGFITPENERKAGCADEGGASIANDALRTSAHPTKSVLSRLQNEEEIA